MTQKSVRTNGNDQMGMNDNEPDTPNQTTVRAMDEALKGKGKKFISVEQMFKEMGLIHLK